MAFSTLCSTAPVALNILVRSVETVLYETYAPQEDWRVYRDRLHVFACALHQNKELLRVIISGEVDVPTLCNMGGRGLATRARRAANEKIEKQCEERKVKPLGREQSAIIGDCPTCSSVRPS